MALTILCWDLLPSFPWVSMSAQPGAITPCPELCPMPRWCFSAALPQPWLCLAVDHTDPRPDPGASVLPGNAHERSGAGTDLGLSPVWMWPPFEERKHLRHKRMNCAVLHASTASKCLCLHVCSRKKNQSMMCFPTQVGTGVPQEKRIM